MTIAEIEDKIVELVVKHLRNELTDDEKKELEEYRLKNHQLKEWIDQFNNEDYLQNRMLQKSEIDTNTAWKEVLERAGIIQPKNKYRIFMRRFAIAASFITIISLCAYLLIHYSRNNSKSKSDLIANVSPEIHSPNNGKAILTLANGEHLLLDTAKNGMLVRQGGISVHKEEGQLNYLAESNAKDVGFNKISTPIGGGYSIVLQDGTKVILNTGSSLTFPTTFVGSDRKVSLTGEAFFDVAPNKSKPFIVTVNNVDIRVLGTQFNVNSYEASSSINTTLFTGKVRVASPAGEATLKPGQQSQSSKNNVKIIDDVNLDVVASWRMNQFYFSATPLQDVMKDLARWYDVTVDYKDNVKASVSGRMNRDLSIQQVIGILNELGTTNISIEGRKVIVQSVRNN